jgi:hypothetical protein
MSSRSKSSSSSSGRKKSSSSSSSSSKSSSGKHRKKSSSRSHGARGGGKAEIDDTPAPADGVQQQGQEAAPPPWTPPPEATAAPVVVPLSEGAIPEKLPNVTEAKKLDALRCVLDYDTLRAGATGLGQVTIDTTQLADKVRMDLVEGTILSLSIQASMAADWKEERANNTGFVGFGTSAYTKPDQVVSANRQFPCYLQRPLSADDVRQLRVGGTWSSKFTCEFPPDTPAALDRNGFFIVWCYTVRGAGGGGNSSSSTAYVVGFKKTKTFYDFSAQLIAPSVPTPVKPGKKPKPPQPPKPVCKMDQRIHMAAPVPGTPLFTPPPDRDTHEYQHQFTISWPKWWVLGQPVVVEVTPSQYLKKPLKKLTLKFFESRVCKRPDTGQVFHNGFSTDRPGEGTSVKFPHSDSGWSSNKQRPGDPPPKDIWTIEAKLDPSVTTTHRLAVILPEGLGQTTPDGPVGSRSWSVAVSTIGSKSKQTTLHGITVLPRIDPRCRDVAAAVDPSGRVFYQNHKTKTTSFENPMAIVDFPGVAPPPLAVRIKTTAEQDIKKKHYAIVCVSGEKGVTDRSESIRSATVADNVFETVHRGVSSPSATVYIQLWRDQKLGSKCIGTHAFSVSLEDVKRGEVTVEGSFVPRKPKEEALGGLEVSVRIP